MKKFTRILSVVLAVVMLFSITTFAAETTTETTKALSDIDTSTVVGKSVEKLVKLGIISGYEDGTYKPNNTVTRGEMAKIIAAFTFKAEELESLLGSLKGIPSGFSDVDDIDHWAKSYIKLASDKKIVVGYEDGTFRPDAEVTYVQVVKMLVCALNYGPVAEARQKTYAPGAPWYQGYMAVAAEKGITKNANVNNQEDPASRGVVAILTSNALDVVPANVSAGGTVTTKPSGGGGGSSNKKPSSALEQLQGKEEVDGIVTAVYQTGLKTGAPGLKNRHVKVETKDGEKIFEVKKSEREDTYPLLGRRIEAYSEDGEFAEDADVLTEITLSKKNEITSLNMDMIEDIDATSISYYPDANSRKKTSKFDSKVSLIYNGKALTEWTEDIFANIKSGNITLIENNYDSLIDVIFVVSYKIYVVNTYDKTGEDVKVYAMYNGGTLDIPTESSSDYIYSFKRDGAEMSPAAVAKWDVISVMQSDPASEGKPVWKGIVTRTKVSNRLTMVDTNSVTIGNKQYQFSYVYEEYTGTKTTFNPNDVGSTRTVYLDHEGKIAAANTTTTGSTASTSTALLINAEKEEGIDGKGFVQLYGITGTTKERLLQLADKVWIDGEEFTTVTAVLEKLEQTAKLANATKDTDGDGNYDIGVSFTPYAQLVIYTVNDAKRVEKIDTVAPNVSIGEDDLEQTLPFPYAENTREDKTFYYASSGQFVKADGISTQVLVNSTTKVVLIPEDIEDLEDITIKSYSGAFSVGKSYRIEAYNVNAVDVAKYVIVYTGVGEEEFTDQSPFIFLTQSVIGKNTQDGPVDSMTGFTLKGEAVTDVFAAKPNLIKGYLAGEIFAYLTNTDEAVKKVKDVIRIVDGKPVLCYEREAGAENYDRLRPLDTAEEAREERIFMVDDTVRTANNSYNRFYFGTVIGRVDNVIKVNNTLATDTNGIDKDAMSENFTLSNTTKVYLYDSKTGTVTSDVKYDEAMKAYTDLEKADADVTTSSKVLIYTTPGRAVKTVIIYR
ncbi:MAG: S-layer homology domain-containing protein [Clostridia bacterium]|nr:S-layer homology domain-containing protein [Clostridia bacterium]